jgi:hypothetical protein
MPSIKKRGLDSGMTSTALSLGILVIVLGVVATVLTTVQQTQVNSTGGASYTTAWNISTKGLEGIKTFSDFIPVLVVIAILGIVIDAFAMYMGGKKD